MTIRVYIVTSRFYTGETLKRAIEQAFADKVNVEAIYRTYNLPEPASLGSSDIIVSNGSCKTRDDQGVSYPVYFDASEYAQVSNATLIPFKVVEVNQASRNPIALLIECLRKCFFNKPRRHPLSEADIQERVMAEIRSRLN